MGRGRRFGRLLRRRALRKGFERGWPIGIYMNSRSKNVNYEQLGNMELEQE